MVKSLGSFGILFALVPFHSDGMRALTSMTMESEIRSNCSNMTLPLSSVNIASGIKKLV
jgi:hypothetical protein